MALHIPWLPERKEMGCVNWAKASRFLENLFFWSEKSLCQVRTSNIFASLIMSQTKLGASVCTYYARWDWTIAKQRESYWLESLDLLHTVPGGGHVIGSTKTRVGQTFLPKWGVEYLQSKIACSCSLIESKNWNHLCIPFLCRRKTSCRISGGVRLIGL